MMVEVKSYLSRVLAPVGDFRVSPWNFDGGPHADTPVHYPSARHSSLVSASASDSLSLVLKRDGSRNVTTTVQRTNERGLVTTVRTLLNCSALLSRDHTATLAHASSRTERRSFDELTRTVNHGYSGEGLASSGDGDARTRTSVSERARTCTSRRGWRLRSVLSVDCRVASTRRTTLCYFRAASRGVA